MSKEEVPTIDSIVQSDLRKGNERKEKHLGSIHSAFESGLKKGILEAVQKVDPSITSYAQITQEHYQQHAESAATIAVDELEQSFLSHYLEDPSVKPGTNIHEIKDHFYRGLLGDKAILNTPEGKKEFEIGRDYFQLIFQNIMSQATSDRDASSKLHGMLAESGIEKQTHEKSLFDFGEKIDPKHRMKDLVSYLGIEGAVDADKIVSGRDYSLFLSLAKEKGMLGDQYQANQTMQVVAKNTPHLLKDGMYKTLVDNKVIHHDFKPQYESDQNRRTGTDG